MKKYNIYALIAAIIGALDSTYLAWIKLTHNETLCAPGLGDCFTVNTSRYAELFGIPIALFGLATYVAIIAILLLEWHLGPLWHRSCRCLIFCLSVLS